MNTSAAKLYFDLFEKCSEQVSLDLPSGEEQEKLAFFLNRFLVNRRMAQALEGAGKPVSTIVEDAASIAKHTKALDAYQKANKVGPYRNAGQAVEKVVDKAAPAAEVAAAAAQKGMGRGKMLGLGALGLGGLGASYYAGRGAEADAQKTQRGLAFGGGLATGLAAPHLMQGVNQIVSNQGLMPGYTPYNFQSI